MTVRVLFLCENEFEDLELWYPLLRLAEEGAKITVAGPQAHAVVKGKHGLTCRPDIGFDEVHSSEYDALFVPGGHAPSKLRRLPRVVEIVREFDTAGKPLGLICHAAELAVAAQILAGREVTGHDSIREEVTRAGAIWRDEAVVHDANLISSRTPADLPRFGKQLVQHFFHRHPAASGSRD